MEPVAPEYQLWQHASMPKRINNKLKDPNEIAAAVVSLATEQPVELDRSIQSRVMAEMGRKGGKIGGKRTLETNVPRQT